ncbi:hypothetical protein OAQ99_07880 [Candidatus Kapabacteria bacterium]|nr:hypothetical protein [Candidatus Kapabacteria bacterium]
MDTELTHIGIDFGSKLAGTTAVSFLLDGKINIRQSQKKKDADLFLKNIIEELKPTKVFIDAPLSLPGVYFDNSKFSNYFYRKCDIEAKAMSPMFFGGLTARAIKIKDKYPNIEFYETYPKKASTNILGNEYKKMKVDEIKTIFSNQKLVFSNQLLNFHQIDSVLCWIVGNNFINGIKNTIGDEEGEIYF